MAKVEVGDLVCMYRRKNKGMGIVLQYTPDIVLESGVDITFEEFMAKIREIDNKYSERASYRRKLKAYAKHPELINTCLTYNAGWARKPKKEFVFIRWFDTPSMYETNQIKEIEEWCPIDWVRKIK